MKNWNDIPEGSSEADAMDDLIRELMLEAGEEQAPADFTDQVMGRISALETQPAYWKPVISRWGWIGIALSFIALVAIALFGFRGPGSTNFTENASQRMDAVGEFFGSWEISSVYVFAVLAILGLASFDYFVRRRVQHK